MMLKSETLEVVRRIETSGGTATWRTLDWDTEQFGIPAARLESLDAGGPYNESLVEKRGLVATVLHQCQEAGICHLSARIDTGDLTSIHALEQAGFLMIDGILTFLSSLKGVYGPAPFGTRLFETRDLPEVLDIGRTSFSFDRFHADPVLSVSLADQINEGWTRNCCLGISADAVVIAEEEGRIAGYVTCRANRRSNIGTIILVATAEWARGRGVACRASAAALHWFADQGINSVEVGTQLRNIPAARLYQRLGFQLIRTSLTFRKVL